MATVNCTELKEKYLELLLGGGEVLIKSGDQLVKYTDAGKLKEVIEALCGPIKPEGSNAQREMRLHGNTFRDPMNCGCSSRRGD